MIRPLLSRANTGQGSSSLRASENELVRIKAVTTFKNVIDPSMVVKSGRWKGFFRQWQDTPTSTPLGVVYDNKLLRMPEE